eukprot:364517-Chlamydomonas_euryale.AAC.3
MRAADRLRLRERPEITLSEAAWDATQATLRTCMHAWQGGGSRERASRAPAPPGVSTAAAV